jgi:PIN domain nuclease of toxin-antitoxin system
VNLLLDTHVWIWSQENPDLLPPQTREAINDRSNGCAVSVISELEIARLAQRKQIELDRGVEEWIDKSIAVLGAHEIELSRVIAVEAYRLPGEFHRDPADRVLVATARLFGMTLVSADRQLLRYRHVNSMSAKR